MTGLALSVITATAATVPSPASGDLFLGFRASDGTGASQSYIVKLGRDTDATFNASGDLTAIGNLGTDLIAKYGAGWKTRADLYWGIFGMRPTGTTVAYGSRQRNPVSSPAVAWAPLPFNERSSVVGRINSVLKGVGGYINSTATANSAVATFQVNSGTDVSYNFQVATAGTSDFGSLSQWDSIEGSFGSGTSGTALDLFRLSGDGETGTNPTTLFGTFTISNAGVVHFAKPTVAPVDVDTDGDGFLDSEEALAGTSPTNPADFFRVQSVTVTPSATVVSFNWIPSRTYNVYYSPDLTIGSWSLIGTLSSGPYTDTDATRKSRTQGFYKVSVTSP